MISLRSCSETNVFGADQETACAHALQVKDEASKVRDKKASGKLIRRSAYNVGRALDHALSLAGSGLSRFSDEHAAVPLLKAGETRYYRPSKRAPDFDASDGVSWRRSCIWCPATKKARFDLPGSNDEKHHTVLALVADEGPKDSPLYNFLAAKKFRFVWLFDPLHRTQNDLRLAATQSDNWSMISDTSVVLNFDSGPFRSSENFGRMKEAIKEFASIGSVGDDLLMSYFEDMCKECNDIPTDFASDEHIERVVTRMPYDVCFSRMDQRVKWSRWGSHHQRILAFRPHRLQKRFALDLVMVLSADPVGDIGRFVLEVDAPPVSDGVPPSSATAASSTASASAVASSSSGGGGGGDGGASSAAASSSSGPAASSVSADAAPAMESTEDPPDKQSISIPRGIDEVRKILACDHIWRRADIWTTFSNVVQEYAATEYSGYLDVEGNVAKFYDSYASGKYFDVLLTLFDRLGRKSELQKAGFMVSFEHEGERRLARDVDSALYLSEKKYAAHAWETIFQIIRFRSLTHQHYTSLPLGKFAGLISEFPSVVADTLVWCKRAWEAIQKFELLRHVYSECQDIWFAVPQCEWVVVRDILCMCDEFSFKVEEIGC